jgi:hypothetical protein
VKTAANQRSENQRRLISYQAAASAIENAQWQYQRIGDENEEKYRMASGSVWWRLGISRRGAATCGMALGGGILAAAAQRRLGDD